VVLGAGVAIPLEDQLLEDMQQYLIMELDLNLEDLLVVEEVLMAYGMVLI
jgi:hypothetical protein